MKKPITFFYIFKLPLDLYMFTKFHYWKIWKNNSFTLSRTRPLKIHIFDFVIFIFSTLNHFSDKTNKKSCCFYNIFSKFTSIIVCLPTFTICLIFSTTWDFAKLQDAELSSSSMVDGSTVEIYIAKLQFTQMN